MARTIEDREYAKFRNENKVAVTLEGDTGLLEGISYDDIQAEIVSAIITNYKYYSAGVLKATIQVTFTNSAHDDVSRVRRL